MGSEKIRTAILVQKIRAIYIRLRVMLFLEYSHQNKILNCLSEITQKTGKGTSRL